MSKIIIGESDGKNVAIDPKILMTTRLLVTSDSGGGKTWLLKRLIEQSFGQAGIIAIDPEGEFAPLRTKFDFFLVGKGGDTPADIRTAEKVARTLLTGRASAICDIYEMPASERHIWVQRFLDALLDAPKELRHPYFVIVDEAHMFCPEHGKGESVASDAMRGLATRGRKRMLCGIYATQRLSSLGKDLTGMCLNRLVGPTFESINQQRAALELGIPKGKEQTDFFAKVKMLDPGYFYAIGRAITKDLKLVHIGEIDTPHGHEALKYELKPPPPTEKVREWLVKLGDLPKQAEEEARTVADFKKQIRDLKTQLRAASASKSRVETVTDDKAVDRAVANASREYQKAISAKEASQRSLIASLEEAMKFIVKVSALGFDDDKDGIDEKEVTEIFKQAGKEIVRQSKIAIAERNAKFDQLKGETTKLLSRLKRALDNRDTIVDVQVQKNKPFSISTAASHPREPVPLGVTDGKLPEGERAVLTAVAQYSDGIQRDRITILTGYKRSTRDAYILRLKNKGYISDNGTITPTPEGLGALGSFEQLPTGDALQEYWKSNLPEGEKKIFAFMLENAGGQPIDRDDLDKCGFARSSRDAYLLRLRARGVVEQVGRGQVKVAPELFD